ncbi:MAG: P1 family peptidase, partial [Nitriliruptoraceae bacterium]
MALGVRGVRIGTWTAPDQVSGCTVVLPPEGSLGAIAVRGSAPGTREAAALGPMGKVEACHAVVLSGGSAYGLSTADGVVRWLEQRGVGYVVPGAVVPIVGAAIVLDGAVWSPASRPGADEGYAACEAAAEEDPAEGRVGVGAGCTVAKVAGLEHAWRSGQGIAVRSAGDVTVGAIVANNAVGEVVDEDGSYLARARVPDDAPRFPMVDPFGRAAPPAATPGDAPPAGPTCDAPPAG